MKFEELLEDLTWDEVKEALIKNHELSDEDLEDYEKVFFKLRAMDSVETKMRICLSYIDENDFFPPDIAGEPYWDIYGRDGTLNKETAFSNNHELQEWLDDETTYALDFTPWNEWLGMEIDGDCANDIRLTRADIASNCLWELTFIAYDEENIQERLDGLKQQVDEIDNMTPEEIKKNTISLDEFEEQIKKWKEEEEEND